MPDNENETDARELLAAAMTALEPLALDKADHLDAAALTAAAVLRKLAEIQRPAWEDDVEWPDPDDLETLADEVERGVES